MKKIGKFTICGLLGKGGMGRVFKIQYPVTGKIAALKLLDPPSILTKLMGRQAIERIFIQEATTMARIRHPHVVEILDFDWFETKPYYIMDFYCNNLGTLIGETHHEKASRVIAIERAVHYMRQTLEGLSCLHFTGVIHRDIKPANLLITDLDTIKICDFGLSKFEKVFFETHGSIRVGSPDYASPEQEKHPDKVDVTTDLYAVGVMLFRLLTGMLPSYTPKAPSALNTDLDDNWDRFIFKAMDKTPSRRFQSADIMAAHLDRLYFRWLEQKEKICSDPALETLKPLPRVTAVSIRAKGEKIPKKEARKKFRLDELMRPAWYIRNDFEKRSRDIVMDHSTGLVWQFSGTRFPLNWQEGHQYVHSLNKDRFGGYDTWRMPTVDELLTIVSPSPRGRDHCIKPAFDVRQKWLWSSDRCTFVSAWYVSCEMGFVAANDVSSFYHVKAVCRPGRRRIAH